MPDNPDHPEWGTGIAKALEYLTDKGYALSVRSRWIRPDHRHVPTEKELSAIRRLLDLNHSSGLER